MDGRPGFRHAIPAGCLLFLTGDIQCIIKVTIVTLLKSVQAITESENAPGILNMEREEIIKYWIDSSDRDFKTMNNLFSAGDYHWALFIGHLVIEKLLKAHYVKLIDAPPPFTHNLLRLAEKADLELNETQKMFWSQ